MSAGSFIRSRYQTNGGAICRIRVQPETELMGVGAGFNDAPEGAVNTATTAKVSKGRREYGIGPRKIGIVFDAGNEPDGYNPGDILYVPILKRTTYDAIVVDGTVTYLANSARVVSKLEESIK